MTCIVGWATGTQVFMGADVRTGHMNDSGIQILPTKTEKILVRPSYLLGISGAARLKDVLELALAHDHAITSPTRFCAELVDLINEDPCWEDGQLAGMLLLAWGGRLYLVSSDLAVTRIDDPGYAIGSGASFALGALQCMAHQEQPSGMIRKALETAAYFDPLCGEPGSIYSIGEGS